MIKDVQGTKLRQGAIVEDFINDEVAKVVDILEDKNKVLIRYFGEENFLNGQIAEVNADEIEVKVE